MIDSPFELILLAPSILIPLRLMRNGPCHFFGRRFVFDKSWVSETTAFTNLEPLAKGLAQRL